LIDQIPDHATRLKLDPGLGLHAGQLVLTGSLVKTLWLKAGDKVRMELDGLGVVEAEFT